MKIFVDQLKLQITPAMNSRTVRNIAFNEANRIFKQRKDSLLKDFNSHPITQDLDAGPDAFGNRSQTMAGVRGNLYSFIGFPKGTEPARELAKTIDEGTTIVKSVVFKKEIFGYVIPVSRISFDEIYEKFPYPVSRKLGGPWNPGSWIKGIETSMSGLNVYLSIAEQGLSASVVKMILGKLKSGEPVSRSGTAVQLKAPGLIAKYGRETEFHPQSYLTGIFNRFQIQFRGRGGRFI